LNAPSDVPDSSRSGRVRGLLYGRRKGPKLSQLQASLFQTLLPQFQLKIEADRDPRNYFNPLVSGVWLEIGFGGGEHLIWQAQHHPHVGILGAEPYEAGVAKLLSKIASLSHPSSGGGWDPPHLPNIRLYQGDARDIIEALPDARLDRVFVLFADPWPKKRHHKRRFIQMESLDALARVMKQGAELRFASDNSDYVAWTLERVFAHESFEWTAEGPRDWRSRPADWPPTRYELKAMHGAPVFLRFRRRALAIG
jgi:tRNA (guanine-N7-)-methyltransferase